MTDVTDRELIWHRVAGLGELPEGRVKTIHVGMHNLALTHYQGSYGALDNRCPHQGGPLGEGTIEHGWLRCPWHGYDYNPLTGEPPPAFTDSPACFPTEVREDGVYVGLPRPHMTERTVSDVLVETMTAWGVEVVFGMVGHSNLGMAAAMHRAERRGDLRYFGIRHEGAASFAASAYGKLAGRPAACFAIAGPGSTNLMTGLYDAKVDRAPVVAISGQVASKVKGRGAFQDLDLASAFADVARYSETVQAGSDHAELMSLACKNALVHRDVAHLMLPDEVQVIPSDQGPGSPQGRVAGFEVPPGHRELEQAIDRVVASRRPLFIVGAGARDSMDPIIELADRVGAPVVTTFKAKGQIPDDHPLACGVLGRSGTPVASWFMNESDLLVVFGASFANHTGIATYKPIVQVDDDEMALGRFHAVDVPVLGDVGLTARMIHDGLPDSRARVHCEQELAERKALWRREKESRSRDDHGRGLNSAVLFDVMSAAIDPDAVIAVDVGNNTYSFGRYFETKRQSILMSGYLGSIGFAMPASLGAWAAVGGRRQVVAVTGDGGFGQYAMELTTAVKYDMDITVILLNNSELGKISKEQRAAEYEVWQTSLHNPDFADFARNCGGMGLRVGDRTALETSLRSALDHPGPALVEVMTDPLLV